MGLVKLLADDLIAWMNAAPDKAPRPILLWLDPDGQFARLLPLLEAELAPRGVGLLRYDPEAGSGQFALKVTLLQREAQGCRTVVYLPGFRREALEPREGGALPELWALYEYRFKGCVWGRGERWEAGQVSEALTLLGWLTRHGLTVADDKTAKAITVGGKESLLARYAAAQARSSPGDWPRPLRLSDVQEALAGDPRDALRQLLAAPGNEVKRWGDERSLVLERIVAEYGLTVPDGEPSPEQLAEAFSVQLALTEAWDAFGRPGDFPFLSRLPAKAEHRQRAVDFLRQDVLAHTELGPRFLQRMLRLEAGYSLTSWAKGRPGQPVGLPVLARNRWQQFLERFNRAAAEGWKAARDLILAERKAIADAMAGPWERLPASGKGSLSLAIHWTVMSDLANLADAATGAIKEADSAKSVTSLASAYVQRWWRVDRLHLRVRAACARFAGLEQVRRVADLAYFEYAAQTNERLASMVEAEGTWPASADIGKLRSALWNIGAGKRAVVVCDALRWDLAEMLKEELADGSCILAPVLATLPSDTEFCMAALLPLGAGSATVEFGAGGLSIRLDDGPNLATRDGRKDALRIALVDRGGKPLVDFVDLPALLAGAKIPNVALIVVFDQSIDEQGHKGTEQLPGLVDQLVGNLKRAIEQLHQAGFDTVHLVTDHGFLLLPPDQVDALGTPEVLPSQAHHKDLRWAALKADAPVTDLLRLPPPVATESFVVGLARGVRTLMKAQAYLHGGLSLQECVIPHLVSTCSLPQARVGLDLSVSTNRLAGGTVPVILRPVIVEAQQPLGGVQPIRARLTVTTVPEAGEEPRAAVEPVEVEVRPDIEELRPPVYLKEGLGLKAGQQLMLQAIDADNGRDLGTILLTLLVDWD